MSDWNMIDAELEDTLEAERKRRKEADGPTDDEVYNRVGVEGAIAYADEAPGSLGEHDWRL